MKNSETLFTLLIDALAEHISSRIHKHRLVSCAVGYVSDLQGSS